MNNKTTIKTGIMLLGCIAGFSLKGWSQVPKKEKTIDITSTFKPVLRESVKINFSAAAPAVDTTRPGLHYTIPAQNLLFVYQPAALSPVALQMDSISSWQYSNYIKVGIGNIHQPLVKTGFSFGDGKNTFFNIFADHYTSKGDRPYQKNSLTSVLGTATYKTPGNLEWNASLGFRSEDYFLYGYQPDTLQFTKEQLRQRYQTIEGKLNMRNTVPTTYGLSYHPNVRVSVFSDNLDNKGTEANTVLNLPLEKTFGEHTGFHLGATADLTNYRLKGNSNTTSQNNNLYYVDAAVLVKTSNVYLHAGIRPSWDQKDLHILPNVMADITTSDQRFTLQLGWIGYYNKGSYQRFAAFNPWLMHPDSLLNDRVIEGYAGFKGSLDAHVSYSAKVGFQQHWNAPLFVNDTTDGKTFGVRYDRFNVFNMHGEVQYMLGEQFSAKAGITLNQYTKLEKEKKAWGMIPLELNAGLRWQVLKDLWLNTDLWAFDGARYQGKDGNAYKGENGFDLSAGAEFRITKNFNLWVQMNNIFNNSYERWNQYPVYGFQVLGGITYSFNQKP